MKSLPSVLTTKNTGLTAKSLTTLRKKQQLLKAAKVEAPGRFKCQELQNVVDATLVFAQEEAGTAVCISQDGIILTCSHCVAESAEEYDSEQKIWLIFASGRLVQATCVLWNPHFDLALLKVFAAEEAGLDTFPRACIAQTMPKERSRLMCVGHPGSEDLEALVSGVKTHYDVLHVSTGAYRGYARSQDIYDNSEIGALMHNCWTYWGHSGAPLVSITSGQLIGLHSSWDSETGMRRGIGIDTVWKFVGTSEDCLNLAPTYSGK